MESYSSKILGGFAFVFAIIGAISTIVGLMVDLPDVCEKYPKVCNYFQIQSTDNGNVSSKVDNKFSVSNKEKKSLGVSSQRSSSSSFEKQYSLDNKKNNVSLKDPVVVSPPKNNTVDKYNNVIVIQKVRSCNLKMSEDWGILKHQLARYLKISENSSYKQFIEALDKKCAK